MKLDVNQSTAAFVTFFLALILMAAALYLSFNEGDTGIVIVNYGAGFMCLFLASSSKFKRFKGLGIEAELRDKIDEADKLLSQLGALVTPIAEMVFSMTARLGRWCTSSDDMGPISPFSKRHFTARCFSSLDC
jgi:hypothetical protein